MNEQIELDGYDVDVTGETGWAYYDSYNVDLPETIGPGTSIGAGDYLISILATFIIAGGFFLVSKDCRHWCLLPLTFCGILSGSDIVAWMRKKLEPLDPKMIVSAFLYLNCFLAPLIHLKYQIYGRSYHIPNWDDYFGYMGLFNMFGIIFYKLAHLSFYKLTRPVKSFWSINGVKFFTAILPALVISLMATAVVKLFFGGLAREVGEVTYKGISGAYAAHLSWIVMLSDPFIILMAMAVIVWLSQKVDPKAKTSLITVIFIILITAVLQFWLVGLRGSRSAFLSMLAVAVGMIHYLLRPFSAKLIIMGIIVMFVFLYLYSFYKKLGREGFQAFYLAEVRKQMAYEVEGGTPISILLGDLARADIQAYMLYRLKENPGNYNCVWGKTYTEAILTFIPRGIWKNKPVSIKGEVGSALLGYSSAWSSTAQYGVAGEAMLNFSYYGIVPAFAVFGCLVGWFRKKMLTLHKFDSRFLLVSLVFFVIGLMVIADSRNWMMGILRRGTLPFLVVFFSCVKVKYASREA
ncbi:MAG: hypothetical protein JW804_08020 [Sedimentisphaerales bacterium]|nr:hypothetical protein [Sedimentisphaerales bacterium]